jgi:hypothetical protein
MLDTLLLELPIYLLTGAVVGFAAGLLGIGGGLIIVPVLTGVFGYWLGFEHSVHLAIGTSLATILITSISSVKAHHQHAAVRWDLVKLLLLGTLLGAFLGGWGSQFFASHLLAIAFGVLEVLIAINLLMAAKPSPQREIPGLAGNTLAGGLIGTLSSLLGIGGGTLTTPYLVWNNVSMHQAIATSTAVSLPIALAGTLGFVIGGLNAEHLPPYSSGYIYWPAFVGIVATSIFTAPIGARLAHTLPVHLLKRLLGVVLLILATKMLFFT